MKRQTCLTNYISFITSAKATYLRDFAFWRRTSPILRFPTYYQRPYRRNQRQQTPAHSSLPLSPSNVFANQLVRLECTKKLSAALHCTGVGAAQYLVGALIALDISGRVGVDHHIRQPTSSRNGLTPGASSSSNSSSLLPTGSGTFLSYFTCIRLHTVRQTFGGKWPTLPSSKTSQKTIRTTTVAHKGYSPAPYHSNPRRTGNTLPSLILQTYHSYVVL